MNQSVVNCIESVDGLNIYSFMSFDNLKTYAKVNSLNKYECNSSLNEKLIDVDGSTSPSSNDNDTSSNAKTSKTYNTRSRLNKTPKTQDINNETNSNNSNSNQAWLVRQFGNEDDYLKRLDDNLTNEDNNSSIIGDNDEEIEPEEDADTEENNETEKNTAYNLLNTRSRSVKSSNVIWQPTISKAGLKSNNNLTNKTKMNKRSLSSSGSSRSSTSSTQSNNNNNSLPECGKEHCRLGCICEALNLSQNAHNKKSANISNIASSSRGSSNKNIFSTGSCNEDSLVYRDHCGRYECMFECTCTRRLRSTTRLIQQTSQSSENRHRNRNSESKSDSRAKHSKKSSSKNASKSSQNKINKSKSSNRKASSSVSSTNSNNQSRSSSVSSDRSESGSVSSSLSSSSASSSSDSNLNNNNNEPNEEYGANKLRKSKRVKHLIRRAEESHAKKKKSNKFEDDYYYYYSNSSQMNSKSKNKLNNKKSSDGGKPKKVKTNEEEELKIKTESIESGEQLNLSGFSSIQKPAKSKCKLDKILNKLNKNNALKNLDKDVRSLIKNAETKNKKEADTQSASIISSFKPYTQSILLKVQFNSLKTSQVQFKSIPLTIEVLTSKWQKNTQLVSNVMKLIARLLQQLESLNESKEVNGWKELEFDYENELSVKMFASHRISAKVLNSSTNNEDKSDVCEIERIKPTVVRVMKFKREEKKENASQSKLWNRIESTVFKSISDLISKSSSSLVAFVSNDPIVSGNNLARKEPFKLIKERFMNTSRSSNELEFSRESLISSMPVGQEKILPRILCTNRRKRRDGNFNKVKTLSIQKQNSVLNKTGLMLKQVDSLFEKIKTSPTLDKTTASLLASILPKNDKSKKKDCFESISPCLLGYRPARIKFSPSNALMSNENLYDDEIKHFSEISQKTKQAELEYPFYQPFKDEKLITDLYKSQNSRDLVDSVCHVVNDMINVVCVYNKNKTTTTTTVNDAKSNAQTSQVQIPPAIKKLTILPNLNHLKSASLALHSNKSDSELTFNLVSLNKPGVPTPPLASNPSSKPIIIINSNKNNTNNESTSKKIEQTPLINSSISSIKLANASETDNAMTKPSDIKYKTLIKILPSDKGAAPNITLKNQMVKLSSSLLTSTKLTQITPTTSSTASSTPTTTSSSVMPRIINTNSTFTRPLILKSLCSISKNSLSSTNRNEVDDFDNEAFKAEVSLPIKMANNKAANPALQTPPCITSFVPIRPKPDQSSSLHQQQIIRLEMKKIAKSPELDKSSAAEVTNCSNEDQLSEGRKRKRKQTFISFKADIQSTQGLGANEEVRDKSKIRIVQCLENSKQSAHGSPLKISTALFKAANKAKDVNQDIDHQDEDETSDSFLFHYYDSDEDIEKNDEDESMPKTSKYNGKVLINYVPE